MSGFFGLMAVLMALISLGSYGISWDLEPRESRPSFATKAWDDLADLLRRFQGAVRNGERRRRASLDAYGNHATDTKTTTILPRSEHS
jgi:hypothetical protein